MATKTQIPANSQHTYVANRLEELRASQFTHGVILTVAGILFPILFTVGMFMFAPEAANDEYGPLSIGIISGLLLLLSVTGINLMVRNRKK